MGKSEQRDAALADPRHTAAPTPLPVPPQTRAETPPLPAEATSVAADERVQRALLDSAFSSSRAKLVVESPPDAPGLDRAVVLWANGAAGELVRSEPRGLVGREVGSLLAPAGPGAFRPEVLRTSRKGRSLVAVLVAGSEPVDVELVAVPSPSTGLWALIMGPSGTLPERLAQEHASAQERRFETLVRHSPVPTIISEAGLRLAHVNDAFCELVGADHEQLLGLAWTTHILGEDLPAVLRCVEQALAGESAQAEVQIVRVDGEHRWVLVRLSPAASPGHGAGFVGTVEDFTERRAFELQLAHQARTDALTGLPNRVALEEDVAARLRAADGLEPDVSVMTCLFLDLDNFKIVNDSLGHETGDQLLVAVAERLRSAVRPGDLVARWGGDEFVVLLEGAADDVAALALGEAVLARLGEGLVVDGLPFSVSASVGVARATARHTGAEHLLQDCDIAMYRAKGEGRNRVALCDAAAREEARDSLALTLDLREALKAGSLRVAYQPVISVSDPTALPAVEALVRWDHPERGPVSPDHFVKIAEANGLIEQLGLFVLEEACSQLVRWCDELGTAAPQKVNVNLSAIQLSSRAVVDDVARVLARTGLPATRLCLEVTETALVHDREASRDRLLRLQAMGVSVALDDFGTGYSSLAYLRQLPVNYLKVDRSFVEELHRGHPQVASAVIGLAHSLGLSAVAEGVEHPEQVEALAALGADLVQGWLYGRAMTPADLVTWRREVRPQHPEAGSR
ncbi:PAS domain S-box-containing protein/diguanylate cyclase (GGDEF) domain-containing protein [Quadrisphaera granulorum]|uniref:PAS domain S-box-containing protein/diguanylate cyclase (GGDEF)-like protein n=1 Tax=Quadrisphaera granulorum TaxID=317664 RepID=A0A316A777_9ACTN|nr:bifunctional diguanylate cyclase/phosphodiesterase [Quadrisphaera granulorum]PWJ52674.1 PAS domain S-box-containing protein/diguanylate cyclase (GGDEF)-like protein [Quadrisphaera granulorum]SZE97496.1 PAS domain S-box-containing protein/diguanylate cyclase (GGDEF) domain-containing protein [Quadrisphaera granulorum]